jgi:hypothetical protein
LTIKRHPLHKSKQITRLNKEVSSCHEENASVQTALKTNQPFYTNLSGGVDSRQDLKDLLQKNMMSIVKISKEAKSEMNFADKLENIRNVSLGIGFVFILTAKFLEPYFLK